MGNYLNLQLFAKSNSTTQSRTESGETSSTQGGSHSESSGWSNTNSSSQSQTVGHEEGGSHSEGSGKSWASGQVEAQTQAQRDKYNTDYQQGNKAQDAYQRLQDTLDKKPQFQSQYENKLNELYDSIMNRDKFSYDFNADSMYQMYKDKYTQAGKKAMENTMAQNAALSGGYGSSYAQTAGQQTYQNYLQQLNDMLPTLRNQAYSEYQDEANRQLQQYNLTNDAYNREYGQYRDLVSDWQSDRAFNQSNYQDERNFDYNQFANERNYWNQEYWNERNAEQSSYNTSDSRNWADSTSNTNTNSTSSTQYGETTNTSNWSNTNSNAWSNTNSSTNYSDNSGSSSAKLQKAFNGTVNGLNSGAANGAASGADNIWSNSSSYKDSLTPQYDSRGFQLNTQPQYDDRGFMLNPQSGSANLKTDSYIAPGTYNMTGLENNSALKNASNARINNLVEDMMNAMSANGRVELDDIRKNIIAIGGTQNDVNWVEEQARKRLGY